MAIGEAGMIGRAPLAAEALRRMAARGFFASRCKAEGGGKKPRGGVAPGRARRSRPRLDQDNREAVRSCRCGMESYGGPALPTPRGIWDRTSTNRVRRPAEHTSAILSLMPTSSAV